MSRIKKFGLKRFTFILGLVLLLALGTIGIGYGAWNDFLKIDLTLDTAEFGPLLEVYKIEREHPSFPARAATYTLDPAIIPDQNGVITVYIGEDLPGSPSLCAIQDNAWRDDKYKIYYRVVNNSSIPIDYRAVEISNTAKASYIALSADNTGWTAIGANGSAADNYAAIDMAILCQNQLNSFNLADSRQGGQIDQTIACVEIKQFNADSTDSGWMKKFNIRVCANELLDLDLSATKLNNINKNGGSGSLDRLTDPAGGVQETGDGLDNNQGEGFLGNSDALGESGDSSGDPPKDGNPEKSGSQDDPGIYDGPAGRPGEPGEDPPGDESDGPVGASGGEPGSDGETGEGNSSQSDDAGGSGEHGSPGAPGDSGNDSGDPGAADDSGGSGDTE